MKPFVEDGSAATEVVGESDPGPTRTPSDVLRLGVAAAVVTVSLLVEWLTSDSIPQVLADLLRGLDVVPGWLVTTLLWTVWLAAAVLLVTGAVSAFRRRRWRSLLTVMAAAGAAVVATAITNAVAPEPARAVIDLDDATAGFPTSYGLAAAAAAVTAAAPWLGRNWRRAGWLAVLGLATARFLTTPISFETERAVLLGWLAGAAAVVAFGGPSRRPSGRAVATGMAAAGVPLARLEQASVDARGSTPYFATAGDGRRLFVKVVGQDERSADLLFRVYRWASPRRLADERPFSSLRRAVEHEALVALFAHDHGIRTPEMVAFTAAEPHAFVLAYEAIDGRSLDGLSAEEVTDDLLRDVWEQVAALRRHRIAHRDLRLANIFVAADGAVWMIDFGFSELAASDTHMAHDLAELLASSALLVGAERAVAAGATALGGPVLAAALPRLHPWALSGATRAAIKERPELLAEITQRVAAGQDHR